MTARITLATLFVVFGLLAAADSAHAVPLPVHRWSFSGNTLDTGTVGGATGALNNGASLVGGRLSLDGINDNMLTAGIGSSIGGNKTLVSWVSLSTLSQASGSALTLQFAGGSQFDGIVYGERTANQWMSGSDGFNRSNGVNNGGALETVIEPGEVMMAITYDTSNNITIYRNGASYAAYNDPTFITHTGTSQALFGLRHTGGGGSPLGGFINEARIYDSTLSAADIAVLFSLGPDAVQQSIIPEPSTFALAALGFLSLVMVFSRKRTR